MGGNYFVTGEGLFLQSHLTGYGARKPARSLVFRWDEVVALDLFEDATGRWAAPDWHPSHGCFSSVLQVHTTAGVECLIGLTAPCHVVRPVLARYWSFMSTAT